MQFDPHTLHQILMRIHQQMRCPQCGKRVPVNIPALKVAGDDFLLLQLKCETCNAYIVLHAALQGAKELQKEVAGEEKQMNASTALHHERQEVSEMRSAIAKSGGSFDRLFGSSPRGDATDIA